MIKFLVIFEIFIKYTSLTLTKGEIELLFFLLNIDIRNLYISACAENIADTNTTNLECYGGRNKKYTRIKNKKTKIKSKNISKKTKNNKNKKHKRTKKRIKTKRKIKTKNTTKKTKKQHNKKNKTSKRYKINKKQYKH